MIAPLSGSLPTTPSPILPSPAAPEGGTGFADALADAARNAAGTLRAAETAAMEGMTGTLGTREVVDRVMEAERTLRTAVAVRDKIVTGWLDISRMQI